MSDHVIQRPIVPDRNDDRRVAEPGWSRQQAREFARELRRRLKGAWEFMTPEVRTAFVAEAVLHVVLSQHRQEVHPASIQRLLEMVTEHM